MSKTAVAANITKSILQDRGREHVERDTIPECFACGRTYTRGTGRFCSLRCRDAFDNGLPPASESPGLHPALMPNLYGLHGWRIIAGPPGVEPGALLYGDGSNLPMGKRGFMISCKHCNKTFDSAGLRCCSPGCERAYRGRQENAAIMTEIGMEVPEKRKCHCGRDIPRYVGVGKRRRLTVATKTTCSARCQKEARKMGTSEGSNSPKQGFG